MSDRARELQGIIDALKLASNEMGIEASVNQVLVMLRIELANEEGSEVDMKSITDSLGLTSASASRITSNLKEFNWR